VSAEPFTLHWFGEPWGAEINTVAIHDATPIGQPCYVCGDLIVSGDQGVSMMIGDGSGNGSRQPMHRGCFAGSAFAGAYAMHQLLDDTPH
jgi:hypothetical protein